MAETVAVSGILRNGLDYGRVRELMAEPRIVDARNLLDPAALRRRHFEYVGVGR